MPEKQKYRKDSYTEKKKKQSMEQRETNSSDSYSN